MTGQEPSTQQHCDCIASLRRLALLTCFFSVSACAATPDVVRHNATTAKTMLQQCVKAEANSPMEANHCYEQWLLDYPNAPQSQQQRYATAARWLSVGQPQRASVLLDDALDRDPEFVMAAALLQTLPQFEVRSVTDDTSHKLTSKQSQELSIASAKPSPAGATASVASTAVTDVAPASQRISEATIASRKPEKGKRRNRKSRSVLDLPEPQQPKVDVKRLRRQPNIRMLVASGSTVDVTFFSGGTFASEPLPTGQPLSLAPTTKKARSRCPKPHCKFALGQMLFKGDLHYREIGGQGHWIVSMPLERYLRGVVPAEMSASWHVEALKAQAVISRTYALRLIAQNPRAPFHLGTTVRHQVYKATQKSKAVDDALATTAGEVLLLDDEPILAYFSADNGGIAETASNVWGQQTEAFIVGSDPYSDRVAHWQLTLSREEIARRLRRKVLRGNEQIRAMHFRHNNNQRVASVRVETDQRNVTVGGNDFRLLVGSTELRSLLFNVTRQGDRYHFSGRGYGHGVGLSQHGAKNMAEQGIDYASILQHYYPTAVRKRLWRPINDRVELW